MSAAQAFAWHERPGALDRLLPPWQDVRIVEAATDIREGARVRLRVKRWGVPLTLTAEHTAYDPPNLFVDELVEGLFTRLFTLWRHRHEFRAAPATDASCTLTDAIEFQLPGGRAAVVCERQTQCELRRMFRYRHTVTREDMAFHQAFADRPRLRIGITGSTGLIGSALTCFLTTAGHHVIRLVRSRRPLPPAAAPPEVRPDNDAARPQPPFAEIRPAHEAAAWWPGEGLIGPVEFHRYDAVIHLAGENIAGGRWTDQQKRKIVDSRVEGTRSLTQSLARLPNPPQTFISMSASGFYGSRADTLLDESAGPGEGFLAETATQWEAAARAAEAAGIRVVHPRLGIVLDPRGAALGKMLAPFRLGLGGRLGGGSQYWSWIAMDDVLAGLLHVLYCEGLHGPINFAAPGAVTNRAFARALGRVLWRPAILPAPKRALRTALGEMADEMLLASCRLAPARLQAAGFRFRWPDLEPALRHLLGR